MSDKEYHEDFIPFSLSDFRKWMESQQDAPPHKRSLLGLEVEPKAPYRKLLSRMDVQEGELEEVARDFKRKGGIIREADGQNILVVVESGSFIIHKMHIKRKDDL